jgi:outer membrane protein
LFGDEFGKLHRTNNPHYSHSAGTAKLLLRVVTVLATESVVQPIKSMMRWPFVLAFAFCPVWATAANAQSPISGSERYPLPDPQVRQQISEAAEFEIQSLPKMVTSPTGQAAETASQVDSELANQFQSAYQNLQNSAPSIPSLTESQIHAVGSKTKVHSHSQPISGGNEFESPFEFFALEPQDQQAPETINGVADVDGSSAEDNPIWWKQLVNQRIEDSKQIQTIDTNALIYQALKNSPRIQAISQNPLIRELQVVEADSDFDAISFVRSKYDDRVDPVGNTLTTGGAPFLEDNIWYGEFGLRKKTRTGASFEISERLGFQNSNSTFFVPQDQATATLALNFSQPLLRGAGKYYNRSQILIAQAAGGAAWDTFVNELQDELQEIADSYWRLYYDRSLYLQKKRNVERGQKILTMLEGRSDLDSLPSQIARARSAVQTRRTDLANALRDIRNSETEIRRQIADRNWLENQSVELLPIEPPIRESAEIPLDQVVYTALENRAEIKEAMKRAKIASIQRDISENELLPELSLLLGTYTSALKGETQMGQAIQDHWGEVTPGYSVGLEFEVPFRNRAARSRHCQRKLQLVKIKSEVEESIQNVIAESQVSLRRVNSGVETIKAAEEAIRAARADLEQNYRRWESFALVEGDLADGQTPTTMLDQLLDSQERLTAAELIYTQAELELNTAEIGLQRSMGTLLMHQDVTYGKACDNCTPNVHVEQFNELKVNGVSVNGPEADLEKTESPVITTLPPMDTIPSADANPSADSNPPVDSNDFAPSMPPTSTTNRYDLSHH